MAMTGAEERTKPAYVGSAHTGQKREKNPNPPFFCSFFSSPALLRPSLLARALKTPFFGVGGGGGERLSSNFSQGELLGKAFWPF